MSSTNSKAETSDSQVSEKRRKTNLDSALSI